MLEKSFPEALSRLGPDEIWLDLGAGKGKAGIEFLRSFSDLKKAPRVALIAYKLDRWLPFPSMEGKLITRDGQTFETMDFSHFGKVDLITDVYGVLSYSQDFHAALSKAFHLLNEGKSLYLYTDVSKTTFTKTDGSVIGLETFLRSIQGLEVTGRLGVLKITKQSDQVQIPLFRLIRYHHEELPPFRRYRLLDYP